MQSSAFQLAAPDGVAVHVYRWLPERPPKAVIQIAHGLAEHAGRYARVAEALTASGYAVYADDHRGHGRTARSPQELGFFAARQGWQHCIDDLWLLTRRIAADHAGLPVLLLGHSMGSAMAQDFMAQHAEALAGVVLSGSGGKPPALAAIGRVVARIERLRVGPRGVSALIHQLAFAPFNKKFAPNRTDADWLSRDEAEVDKYVADPLCGFRASVQLWIDLLDAIAAINAPGAASRIAKRLPIFVIAGASDPVSDGTKGLRSMLDAYRAAGLERVSHRFYEGARHELLNETNRDEVTRDLIAWCDGVVGS
jgi:alpha-beta hydrolase superfamily lysophospholipase